MNLEIDVDYDAEEIHLILDDHLSLWARRELNGETTYSKNFDEVVDDPTFITLKEIIRSIFKHLVP